MTREALGTVGIAGADTAAVGTAWGAMFGIIPEATAVLSLIYLLLRIWETETVRNLTVRSLTGENDNGH